MSVMSARFRGAVKSCEDCGRTFKVPPSRAKTARYCSIKCAAPHRMEGLGKSLMLVCPACNSEFKVPRSHMHRRKYCSEECKHGDAVYLKALSKRTAGSKNPSWAGGRTMQSGGYVYRHAPYHPFSSNSYVFEHRLVMERWLRENEPGSPYLVRLGDNLFLSPEFLVHHDDENKQNNAIENLVCMTPSEHRKHHNTARSTT